MNDTIPLTQIGNLTAQVLPETTATLPVVEEGASSYLVYLIAVAALLIALFLISKRKVKTSKKEIGIVGERGAGKTQLFIGLSGGKTFETVPSIANNNCELDLGRNKYQLCDFLGDNLSK